LYSKNFAFFYFVFWASVVVATAILRTLALMQRAFLTLISAGHPQCLIAFCVHGHVRDSLFLEFALDDMP
jgi:hypothetical protein